MGAQGRLWVSNLDGFDIWRSYFWVWQRPFGILHEMFFIMYGENGGPCLTFTLYVSGPSEFSVPIQTFLYRPCQTVPVGAWQHRQPFQKFAKPGSDPFLRFSSAREVHLVYQAGCAMFWQKPVLNSSSLSLRVMHRLLSFPKFSTPSAT